MNLNKLESNKNEEIKELKKGKDTFTFSGKNYTVYLANVVTMYIEIDKKPENMQELRNTIEDEYCRPLFIKYTVMGYIIPQRFEYTEKGLIYNKVKIKKIDGEEVEEIIPIIISNKWLFVSARVFSLEQEHFQHEIKAVLPENKKEIVKICNKEVISRGTLCINFLSGELGVDVIDRNCNYLTDFFISFLRANKKIERKVTMPTLGWNKDLTKFAPYSEDIHLDYSKDRFNYFRQLVKSFSTKNDIKQFMERVKFHTENKDSDFIFSACLSAPLFKLIGVRSFLLNVYGTSKNQKSLSVRLGLSVFGNYKEMEMNGKDTSNSIMSKIYLLQNLPFSIDEIVQKGANKQTTVDGYIIGNERNKGRLNKDSEIKSTNGWRSICITTSESIMQNDSDMSGEKNRTMNINVDCRPSSFKHSDKDCHKYAVGLYRFLENNCGIIGNDYIDYILNQGKDNLMKYYEEIENYLIDQNNEMNLMDNISSVAIICLANYLYRKMFFNIDDIVYSKNLGINVLGKLQTKKELDTNQMYLNTIYSFFEVNMASFIKKGVKNQPIPKPLFGSIDDKHNEIIFIIEPLKKYLQENNYDWNYLKEMAKEGFVELKNKRISNQQGKRIIIPLNKDLEGKIIQLEREGIQND